MGCTLTYTSAKTPKAKMENNILCAGIEKAIDLEAWSQSFFMKCTASTSNPIGRRMFESFAKQSCVARERLDRLYKSYYNEEYMEYSKKPASGALEEFQISVSAGSLDTKNKILPILENASKAVETIISLYRTLSDGSGDKSIKKFFSGLADEKEKEVQLMRTQYEYIKGTGCYTEYK
jgi:rubrerythrin